MTSQLGGSSPSIVRSSVSFADDPAIPLVGVDPNGLRAGRQRPAGYGTDAADAARTGVRAHRRGGGGSSGAFKYENVGARLARRKELFSRRKLLADLGLLFALAGILLMIVETEFCIAGVIRKDHAASLALKCLISLTTVILLGFVTWYHWLDIMVFMIDNSMDDWRLAVDAGRVLRVTLELAVCAVHPMPGQHDILGADELGPAHRLPVDFLLGLPMFLRFYLGCRVLVLHSRLFQDASSQSLGALNRVPFNFRFIFKSLMSLYPEYVLTAAALALFVWASWATRACEMYRGRSHRSFLNSMWLTAITFLTVGYGDVVPVTYCSRAIAVLTGIFGTGVTALVVAVLARRLELSRAEKYVHNFVIDIELDKRVRHAAANILKEGWLSFKFKRASDVTRTLRHQRRLLHSIYRIRQLRNDQKRLADNSIGLLEMHKNQGFILAGLQHLQIRVKEIEDHLTSIDDKLDRLIALTESKIRK